jgi:peptide/nickel transport system permease protein
VPTLIGISLIIFAILALAPGDPMSQFATDPNIPHEVRENIKRSLGLDQPWPTRYFKWVTSMMVGDWGFSFSSRIPVWDLIWQRLPSTLWVVGLAYIIAIPLAIMIGAISAAKQYSLFDQVATAFAFMGFSIPTFFSSMVLIIIFSVKLNWLPFIYDSTLRITNIQTLITHFKQISMPVMVITVLNTAMLVRFVRASVLDNISQNYVRTARAKGLTEKAVIVRHVLRNSLIPVVTLIALSIPSIFAGAIVTEQIFRVPGIGDLLINSILKSDTPVVMGITFTYSILVVISNILADALYSVLDPRIRLE